MKHDSKNPLAKDSILKTFREEIETELIRILSYWEQLTPDPLHGGFIGRIDNDNHRDLHAAKGSVLNARILWAYSAAYNFQPLTAARELATRAYEYLRDYMTDKEFGGLYWTVDYSGHALDSHKQIYAQAFGIYAMSEYYKLSGSEEALSNALILYRLIEKYSRDTVGGGYREAFAADWNASDDQRLSEKDENAPKTMNTHLHIVEAYANLYEVWPDEQLRLNIISLLAIFDDVIINHKTFHLGLFFADDWTSHEKTISYGHDIEAAWLLHACAVSIQEHSFIEKTRNTVLQITDAAMEGLDPDGGLWYEYDTRSHAMVYEKHWWPQAEALVGFCYAWQLSSDDQYKQAMLNTWNFIRKNILDKKNGEWFWGVDRENNPMPAQDKVGLWKCPYHNARACLELLKRLPAQT